MHCSHLFSKESFSFAIKSRGGHVAILYHSCLVGTNRNSLSRPTCFELPPPAELFFLWLSNASIRLEASNEKQIQAVRGPVTGKHTPPARTAQGWLQLLSLQAVFSTPGTESVGPERKTSSVIAESFTWLSYGFGRTMSIGHACRRAAFPEHPTHSFGSAHLNTSFLAQPEGVCQRVFAYFLLISLPVLLC